MSNDLDAVNALQTERLSKNVVSGVDSLGEINALYVDANGRVNTNTVYVDGTGSLDLSDNAVIVIGSDHAQVHKGNAFKASQIISLAGSSTVYYQFKTGAKIVHFKHRLISADKNVIIFQVYENPVVTDGTTEVAIINANRNSATVSTVKIYTNPTVVSGGTLTDNDMLAGTSTGSSAVTSGPSVNEMEWIYKVNTNYLVKLTNQNSGTAQFMFRYFWYEIA